MTTTFIRFWWSTYSPEDILDSFTSPEFEVSKDNHNFRPARADILTVADWMIDNDKSIVHTELNRHRRVSRRWQGQFTLAIGAE